jgi:asparagine synthetase B (glutamine-hydrolysing)
VTNSIKDISTTLYRSEKWERSTSKVVFSGLGADEVWAGYSRYKTALLKGGADGLRTEMSLDLDRLWHRNMGRDDRAISHNGKEARFPFLDIDLQSYLGNKVFTENSTDQSPWFDLSM